MLRCECPAPGTAEPPSAKEKSRWPRSPRKQWVWSMVPSRETSLWGKKEMTSLLPCKVPDRQPFCTDIRANLISECSLSHSVLLAAHGLYCFLVPYTPLCPPPTPTSQSSLSYPGQWVSSFPTVTCLREFKELKDSLCVNLSQGTVTMPLGRMC